MSGKLEKLVTKQQQIKEQIKHEKSKQSQLQRKLDTRKKILVGAMLLHWVEQGQFPEADLLARLDGFLSRDQDRAIFGLPPKAAAIVAEPTAPNPPPKSAEPSSTNDAITRKLGSPTPASPPPAPRTRLVERQEQAELEKEFL